MDSETEHDTAVSGYDKFMFRARVLPSLHPEESFINSPAPNPEGGAPIVRILKIYINQSMLTSLVSKP